MRTWHKLAALPLALVVGLGTQVQAAPAADVVYSIKTTDKVFFLTIDDGWTMNRAARQLILDQHLPVTLFLIGTIWRDPAHQKFFKPLVTAGAEVGNHTFAHSKLKGLSKATQAKAICKGRTTIGNKSGVFPTWVRPPYGAYDSKTKIAAGTCQTSHLVLWNVSAAGKRLSTWGGPMKAGDIVLLHWDNRTDQTLRNILAAAAKQGLKPARLSDYLTP